MDRYNDLERVEVVNRLERLADIRSSVVVRGKSLIANPNYPDSMIVQHVSRLLSKKLTV